MEGMFLSVGLKKKKKVQVKAQRQCELTTVGEKVSISNTHVMLAGEAEISRGCTGTNLK